MDPKNAAAIAYLALVSISGTDLDDPALRNVVAAV